jgi:vacuolar protein sorting-associated protein 51
VSDADEWIDSPAFNAEGYFNQLAITSSLPVLLKRENELAEGSVPYLATEIGSEKISEIRQLDGERQSLVYNHHHELIAASDTIRAVSQPLHCGDSYPSLAYPLFGDRR